jgi:integrase/recombinase XerC
LKSWEAEALLDSTTGQERAIIACGLSGLRVSEIRDLNVAQFEDSRLRNVVGKGGKIRTVPLTTQAEQAIAQWAQGRSDGPLFSLQGGRRITTRSIQNIVSRASRKALGRHINPHALRHTFGTLGAKADIPALKMMTLMGHGDISTTKLYVHLDDDDLLQEVRKLDTAKPIRQKNHLQLVHSQVG